MLATAQIALSTILSTQFSFGRLFAQASRRSHELWARGVGSLLAFTLESPDARNQLLGALREKRMLALPCGERSVRFRLPFVVTESEVDRALETLAACLPATGAVRV